MYWGQDDYIAHQGDFSIWCAAEGGIYEYYSNCMLAYINNKDPLYSINLQEYDSAYLEFWVWYDTEPGKDYFEYLYSYNPEYDYWRTIGYARSGDSNGWIRLTHDIPSDMDQYYFQFYFDSDSTNNEYDGVNIDDIVVKAYQPEPPNIRFYKPTFWVDSVIINHDGCDSSGNPLLANFDTYLQWGVMNDGESSTEYSFKSAVYIDDILVAEIIHPYLNSMEKDDYWGYFDTSYSLGTHTIKIILDSDSTIAESNEDDNVFTRTYNFIEAWPNLTYNTPSGWTAPLLISAERGMLLDQTVYANDTVFASWGVINSGTLRADSSISRIKVDGVSVGGVLIPGLEPDIEYAVEDFPLFITDTGYHSITVEHDCYDWVSESYEQDNDYDKIYYWHPPYLTTSGIVSYREKKVLGFYSHPVDNYYIELWDYDMTTLSPRINLLPNDTLFTNNTGYFKFDSIVNIDNDGTPLDIVIRVYAMNNCVQVKYDTTNLPVFNFSSSIVENVNSGTHVWNYGNPINIDTTNGQSSYFYVGDVIRENHNFWKDTLALSNPGTTNVVLSDTIGCSYYNKTADLLFICSDVDWDKYLPDIYDKDVIRHEFGHRLHRKNGFFDDNVQATYEFLSIIPPGLAAREGFANFWSLASGSKNNKYYSSYNNFLDTLWLDLETGEWGQCGNGMSGGTPYDTTWGTGNAMGDSCLLAVAGMFWDIYDDNAGMEDYSGVQDWGDTTRPHHPDGIGDTLCTGLGPIMGALLNKVCGKPQTMAEFWQAWYNSPTGGHDQAMADIWYEHGVDYHSCCVGLRGNANCSFLEEPDISDVNRIIDHLYQSRDPLCCFEEADIVVSGEIDISDITRLIDYLYQSHAPLTTCP